MSRDTIEKIYLDVYGPQSKKHLGQLFKLMDSAKALRKKELLLLDDNQKNWYFSESLVGMTLYIDLFAGDFKTLIQKVDYFKELGITFIHLMPLLKPREGENDGGYAVEDYRHVNPDLGSDEDFIKLLDVYRSEDIYICIDYVINHVAKENKWAQEALKGDQRKQDYFIMFDTNEMPTRFNRSVPEVLPDKCPGNFTFYEEINKYVFTSFSDFQWDLNFKNPEVFNGMSDHLLYLANLGVNMIRLDAIPFMWKEVDTSCRNLEPIHDLMRLFHLIKEDVCPSLALLGEAIVEPEEIVKYFGNDQNSECEIMYNANLMVDIYNAFATRDARILSVDANRFQLPQKASWMNYVRCHDDIGWGFNNQAIQSFGMDPFAHKQFLIKFYGNEFEGSFSKGEFYQYNSLTRDARTNGTLASLLGLEKAIELKEEYRQYEAIRRINLAHALIMSYRGFPLLYSGDEIATLNDQSYKKDPAKMNEGRWVHRPFFDWKRAKKKDEKGNFEYDVYQALKKMIEIRKELPYLHGQATQFALDVRNQSVFCLVRRHNNQSFFALFNFSEQTQSVQLDVLRQILTAQNYQDLIQGRRFDMNQSSITLSPYEYIWAKPEK